jgi:hypothetical protein
MSTVGARGRSHIHTAYFAYGPDLAIYFYSYATSHHARNLERNRSMAVAVFDSRQVWGRSDQGVQLFGYGRRLEGRQRELAASIYGRRFPGFRRWVHTLERTDGRFGLAPFRFTPSRLVLFDERAFGSGVFVRIPSVRTTTAAARKSLRRP